MTPSGSFQGSKRDTCSMSRRPTSSPNWLTMYSASSGDRAMFLGESGSMAGGTTTGSGTRGSAGM